MKTKPFYKFKEFKTNKGKTIINALCSCGALQTEHLPSMPGIENSQGHGPCPLKGCPKFTWVKYIFKKGA